MYDVAEVSARECRFGTMDKSNTRAPRTGAGRRRGRVVLAFLLAAGGCTANARPGSAQFPEYVRFPETDVVKGVSVFRDAMAKGGMVRVADVSRKCAGTTAPGMGQVLVRQCFAFETAASLVAGDHDARTRSAPLPGLSRADFDRRLDGYCAAMGITRPDCPAARTSMSEQVAHAVRR